MITTKIVLIYLLVGFVIKSGSEYWKNRPDDSRFDRLFSDCAFAILYPLFYFILGINYIKSTNYSKIVEKFKN